MTEEQKTFQEQTIYRELDAAAHLLVAAQSFVLMKEFDQAKDCITKAILFAQPALSAVMYRCD